MLKKILLAVFATFALMSMAFAAVDLNSANQAQLESLTGIGPAKAKDIIDFRTKNGPFKTTEDVMKVPGIKEGTYAKIKGEISVNGKVAAPSMPAKTEKSMKASAPTKAEMPAKASATAKK
jgi:competence protein ComEA